MFQRNRKLLRKRSETKEREKVGNENRVSWGPGVVENEGMTERRRSPRNKPMLGFIRRLKVRKECTWGPYRYCPEKGKWRRICEDYVAGR